MVCGGFRFVRFFVLSESMVEQMPRNLSEPPSCLRWHPMLCAAGTSRWPTTRSKASCRSCRPSSSAAPTSGGSASSATRRAPGCRPPPPRQCTRARPPHLPHLPVHSSVWLEAFLELEFLRCIFFDDHFWPFASSQWQYFAIVVYFQYCAISECASRPEHQKPFRVVSALPC